MRLFARCASAALLLLVPLAGASPAAAGPSGDPAGPAPLHQSTHAVPDQYIVTVSEDADAEEVAARVGAEPKFVYRSVVHGFAAELSAEQLRSVRGLSGVSAVEEAGEVSVAPPPGGAATQAVGSWGQDRIDQRYLPLDGEYSVREDGRGVSVYILDTGIDYDHSEFEGRAVFGFDAIGDGRNGRDCNGHGTHVAGTVGGHTYGVAPGVRLVSVRVMNCSGSGSWAGVLAGLDFVHAQRDAAVLNASFGGPQSDVVDDAVNAVARDGVLPVAAAGNSDRDACDVSPAGARRAMTVGATDQRDHETFFSNHGSCLDLYAPGQSIVSAWPGGSRTLSGTSMAAPHVAGAAALVKARFPLADGRLLAEALRWEATRDVVRDIDASSPNRLLYAGWL